jgi:hypothetical protein
MRLKAPGHLLFVTVCLSLCIIAESYSPVTIFKDFSTGTVVRDCVYAGSWDPRAFVDVESHCRTPAAEYAMFLHFSPEEVRFLWLSFRRPLPAQNSLKSRVSCVNHLDPPCFVCDMRIWQGSSRDPRAAWNESRSLPALSRPSSKKSLEGESADFCMQNLADKKWPPRSSSYVLRRMKNPACFYPGRSVPSCCRDLVVCGTRRDVFREFAKKLISACVVLPAFMTQGSQVWQDQPHNILSHFLA